MLALVPRVLRDPLAASPGEFFVDRAPRRCKFADPEQEEALWAACEALVRG